MANYSHRKWPVYALIIGVALVIITGGATHEYSQAFLLLLTGAFLIFTPIEKTPERGALLPLLALLGWMLISTWVPFPVKTAADWIALKDPVLSSGVAVSAQPWLSFEKTGFYFVGLCWLMLVMQRPLSHYRRLEILQWVVWMVGTLAAVTVVCSVLKIQHPFTWGTHRFSFFPNHNQSGAVLAMGGILALGFIVRSMRKREWEMFAYMAVFAIICVALFMGMSRSAVIIMIGGSVLYILLTLEKKHYRFYLKMGVPFVVIFAALFLLYGGSLLDEFVGVLKTGGLGEEIRVHIWMDATQMASSFALFGVGLGNFRYFFPYFIHQASTPQSIYHPESDFLWIWCELGLVGLIIVMVGIVALLRRLDLVDIFKSKGTRLMGFVAICMFLLASMIEVSGHRLGTVLLVLLIYGLIQPEDVKLHRFAGLTLISRFVGIMFILASGYWTYGMLLDKPLVSTEVIAYSLRDTDEIYRKIEPAEFDQILDGWINRYPMMPGLHNLKGITAVSTGNLERAVDGFDKSHLLNPVWWRPYMNHGLYLQAPDFVTALRYWKEGLAVAGSERMEAFEFLVPKVDPSKLADLRDLTYGDRNLQFLYFSRLRFIPVEFSRELGLELAINPELKGFRSEQKQAMLWRFGQLNGSVMLKRLLDRYPVLGSENWTIRAQMRAGEGQYKEASRLAVMNLPEPEMIDLTKSRTLTVIRTEYLLDSDDPLKVIALVQRQKHDANYQDAQITLEIARSKGVKHEYLEYQLALVYFHLGKYKDSWERFERIIDKSVKWDKL